MERTYPGNARGNRRVVQRVRKTKQGLFYNGRGSIRWGREEARAGEEGSRNGGEHNSRLPGRASEKKALSRAALFKEEGGKDRKNRLAKHI